MMGFSHREERLSICKAFKLEAYSVAEKSLAFGILLAFPEVGG
jgi:hypothetical protein